MKSTFLLVPFVGLVFCSTTFACSNEATPAGDALGDASVDASVDAPQVQTNEDPPLSAPPTPAPSKIAVTDGHACVVFDGAVKCFGTNLYGQFGVKDDTNKVPFTRPLTTVPGIGDAVEVGVSSGKTCARHADGTVSCWGVNRYGGLGAPATVPCGHNDSELCRMEPQKVAGLANVVKIAISDSKSCALLADGTMKCWGGGSPAATGELRQVPFAERLVDIGFLRTDLCGVTTSKTVRCFSHGDTKRPKPLSAKPNGPPLEGLTAVPVGIGSLGPEVVLQRGAQVSQGAAMAPFGAVSRVVSGGQFACALLEDGAARCWGSPLGDVLGFTGPTRSVNGDVDIQIENATQISAAPATDIAVTGRWGCVLVGRSVTCWGRPNVEPTAVRPGQTGTPIYYDIRL